MTLDQALSMTRALLKGEPEWRGVLRQSFRDRLSELLPR